MARNFWIGRGRDEHRVAALGGRYVDYAFTSGMEGQLDEITAERAERSQVLRRFWDDFFQACSSAEQISMREVSGPGNKKDCDRMPLSSPPSGMKQRFPARHAATFPSRIIALLSLSLHTHAIAPRSSKGWTERLGRGSFRPGPMGGRRGPAPNADRLVWYWLPCPQLLSGSKR